MKPSPKLLLALAFALSIGGRAQPQALAQGKHQADLVSHAPAISAIPAAPEPPALGLHPKVTRYATGFDGDHSLEEATVVEQAFAQYSLYTIRLEFASGAQQSVVLTAPPGGLQPEMRDMSGDNVPNDLVLTSRLFGLPLIVLLNEGHDHLTVAISPGTFTSGEGRASGPHQVHLASALPTSGIKRGALANSGDLHFPQLEEKLLSPFAPQSAKYAEHPYASGRAPPALVAPLFRAA